MNNEVSQQTINKYLEEIRLALLDSKELYDALGNFILGNSFSLKDYERLDQFVVDKAAELDREKL